MHSGSMAEPTPGRAGSDERPSVCSEIQAPAHRVDRGDDAHRAPPLVDDRKGVDPVVEHQLHRVRYRGLRPHCDDAVGHHLVDALAERRQVGSAGQPLVGRYGAQRGEDVTVGDDADYDTSVDHDDMVEPSFGHDVADVGESVVETDRLRPPDYERRNLSVGARWHAPVIVRDLAGFSVAEHGIPPPAGRAIRAELVGSHLAPLLPGARPETAAATLPGMTRGRLVRLLVGLAIVTALLASSAAAASAAKAPRATLVFAFHPF